MARGAQGKNPSNLGVVLLKGKKKQRQDKRKAPSQYAGRHITDVITDGGAGRLESVTDRNELDEFLCNALLADRTFEAERERNIVILDTPDSVQEVGAPPPSTVEDVKEEMIKFAHEHLSIPRRPRWTKDMTREQLDLEERNSFLEWRRKLAQLEESSRKPVTPFEKNLEVWRQLWRVLERSDIIVQVVDARNPLLYRCEDLENYIKDVDPHKLTVLLINKADFLTPTQRAIWARYFSSRKIHFVFFSAAKEQIEIDAEAKALRDLQHERDRETTTHHRHKNELTEPETDPAEADADAVTESVNAGTNASGDTAAQTPSATPAARSPDTALLGLERNNAFDGLSDEEAEDEEVDAANDEVDDADEAKSAKPVAVTSTQQAGTDKKDSRASAPVDSKVDDRAHDDDINAVPSEVYGSKHVNFKVPSELHDNEQSAAANVAQQHQDKRRPWDLLSRHEFLRYCVRLFRDHSKGKLQAIRQDGRITLGMVGYPNVGKSSTINALCESKRVSVAPTPGHTKHFQTLFIGEDICVCDCPGLVFPTILSSAGEMVCSGILPIDQCRDYVGPMKIVAQRISREQFYHIYRLVFPKWRPIYYLEVMDKYALAKGFMKDQGRPDDSKAARIILKDYMNGKLLHCHPPPELTDEEKRVFEAASTQSALSGNLAETAFGVEEASDGPPIEKAPTPSILTASNMQTQDAVEEFTVPVTEENGPADPVFDAMYRPGQNKPKPTGKDVRRQKRMNKIINGKKSRNAFQGVDQAAVEAHTRGKHATVGFRRMEIGKV